MMKVCTETGCSKPEDREGLCFRHRISGIRFGFTGGGGYGRKAFHEKTTKEAQNEIIEGARRDGREIRPKPVRAELI